LHVAAAWQGKELLRAVYRAVGMPAARAALDRFYRWCDGVGVPELSRLARTVRAWEAEILAFHATGGCSNGPTEAVNLLVKQVKRVGHGFRNFANYRLLLHCAVRWQSHRTARLRGRLAGRRDSRLLGCRFKQDTAERLHTPRVCGPAQPVAAG
jgi:transposase